MIWLIVVFFGLAFGCHLVFRRSFVIICVFCVLLLRFTDEVEDPAQTEDVHVILSCIGIKSKT